MINETMINVKSIYWHRYLKFLDSRSMREIPVGSYTEVHHKIPKCVGGLDNYDNLIKLTVREHYVAHYLLSKVGLGQHFHKLRKAFAMMAVYSKSNNTRSFLTSREVEIAKKVGRESNCANRPDAKTVKGYKWYIDSNDELFRCTNSDPRIQQNNLKPANAPSKGEKWYTNGMQFFMLHPSNPIINILNLQLGCPVTGTTKTYTDESKASLQQDRANRLWYNDGTISYKLKDNDPKIIELSLVKGRLISDEGKKKIKKGAAWTRTDEHKKAISVRCSNKQRFNDGVKNYTLDKDSPLIQELNLVRGVILSPEGRQKIKESSKSRDVSHLTGKQWFNDGTKNYRLDKDDPKIIELSLVHGLLN
jgi:hypothetical protein